MEIFQPNQNRGKSKVYDTKGDGAKNQCNFLPIFPPKIAIMKDNSPNSHKPIFMEFIEKSQ